MKRHQLLVLQHDLVHVIAQFFPFPGNQTVRFLYGKLIGFSFKCNQGFQFGKAETDSLSTPDHMYQ